MRQQSTCKSHPDALFGELGSYEGLNAHKNTSQLSKATIHSKTSGLTTNGRNLSVAKPARQFGHAMQIYPCL